MQTLSNPYFDIYDSYKNSVKPLNWKNFESLAVHLGLMHNALGLGIKDLLFMINQKNNGINEDELLVINEDNDQMERVIQKLSSYSEKSVSVAEIIQVTSSKVVFGVQQIKSTNYNQNNSKMIIESQQASRSQSIDFIDYAYKKPSQSKTIASLVCHSCNKITDLGPNGICFKCKKKDKVVYNIP